jgi:WD40 repeat protein
MAAASSVADAAHRAVAGQQSTAVPGGTQVWAQRFGGQFLSATASSVAASPNKTVVYVTGITAKTATGLRNEVTVAYNATTGKQLWLERYQGTDHHPRGFAGIPSITVSPDGATVYVAGDLAKSGVFNDYLMLAYNAATGALHWAATPVTFAFAAQFNAAAVSPDSKTVYMTGRRDFFGGNASKSYVTVAVNAATGATKWTASTTTPAHVGHSLTSLALSPDGSTVFIAGSSGTVAYDAATGHQLWLANYRTASVNDNATGLAVSPDGSTVYVTGTSIANYNTPADYATVAYSATSGTQLWSARYAVTGAQNNAAGVIVSGGNAIVTGTSGPYGSPSQFATVAYQG